MTIVVDRIMKVGHDSFRTEPEVKMQIRIAHHLARVHGHLWGTAMSPEMAVSIFDAYGIKGISEIVGRLESAQFGGIVGPVEEDGVVTHTTGTGRTRWEVFEDGHVLIQINRPSGMVFEAVVSPEGEITVLDILGDFEARHVDALETALGAVMEAHWGNATVGFSRGGEALEPPFLSEPIDGFHRAAAERLARFKKSLQSPTK